MHKVLITVVACIAASLVGLFLGAMVFRTFQFFDDIHDIRWHMDRAAR